MRSIPAVVNDVIFLASALRAARLRKKASAIASHASPRILNGGSWSAKAATKAKAPAA